MPETKDLAPALQPEGPDMPDDEVLYELADLFRVFGDSTRIKILYALHDSELCVQDIADAVQLSQSAVSHQLRLLKTSKLVKFRREGKTALLVTHDIAEAVSMSDRVIVLSRRPAVVKAEMDMGALRGLPPLERRDTPEFHRYFNAIWKELELRE